MTKPPKIETEPGAQQRFERAVDYMLHTPSKKHEPLRKKRKTKKRKRSGV